jgi:DNA-binding HxlR family transcriptional regulator
MSTKPYGMICPITKACEVLEPRWTIPILTEIWSGSSRFNDIRRGVGNISPTLLPKRLTEMEANGLIEREENQQTGYTEYVRTQSAIELEPALNAMAVWAQKNVIADIALSNTNQDALMWKLRRSLVTVELPKRRIVIKFQFTDTNLDYNTYWLLKQPGIAAELCITEPEVEVNLFIEVALASLAAIMTGRSNFYRELERDHLFVSGDQELIQTMPQWLPRSDYADAKDVSMVG